MTARVKGQEEAVEADSVDGTEETPSAAIARELARVGRHTTELLRSAGDTAAKIVADAKTDAERIRQEATEQADATRAEADAHAVRTRTEADSFAREARGNAYSFSQERRRRAEAEAESRLADARGQADDILGVVHGKKIALETVVADLSEKREGLLLQLETMADSIQGTTKRHRKGVDEIDPVPVESDEFRPPAGPAWENPLDALSDELKAEDSVITGSTDEVETDADVFEGYKTPDLKPLMEAGDALDADGNQPKAKEKARRRWGRRSSPWLPPRGIDADAVTSESIPPPG